MPVHRIELFILFKTGFLNRIDRIFVIYPRQNVPVDEDCNENTKHYPRQLPAKMCQFNRIVITNSDGSGSRRAFLLVYIPAKMFI